MPQDEEQLALTLNGKKRNIRKKDFKVFAENCGISRKSAEKMIEKICSLKEKFLAQCDDSYLPDEWKVKTKELIGKRIELIG